MKDGIAEDNMRVCLEAEEDKLVRRKHLERDFKVEASAEGYRAKG
jgi:hypothetical protein